MLDKEFLDLLACPKCKGEIREQNDRGEEVVRRTDLEYDTAQGKLICHTCRLKYGVSEDDIPNFLIDEAESF